MASGLSRRARKLLAGLCPFLLSGCLEFEPVSTVCWEPSGREVAFLSSGRPWVFSLPTGELSPLPSEGPFASLACSPDGGWIAASSHTYLSLFRREGGEYVSDETFALPPGGGLIPPVLSWRPDSGSLLIGSAGAEIVTFEADLGSGTLTRLGSGLAIYEAADRLIWGTKAVLGPDRELMVLDSQDPQGRPLTLAPGARDGLEDGAFDVLSTQGDFSALPPCWTQRSSSKTAHTVCLNGGAPVIRGRNLPTDSRVFPSPGRNLFAVVIDKADSDLSLFVYDARGIKRAEGARLLKTLDEELARAGRDRKDNSKAIPASRIAWDPGGNWLAWVVDGRLFLWNWRNDILSVRAP